MIKYYKIVDIETGEKVCEGRTAYLSRYLDTDESTIRRSAKHGRKIKYKYLAVEIPKTKMVVDKIIKKHEETDIEQTERLLRIYGNTNLKKNKENVVECLKEKGYRLAVKEYKKVEPKYVGDDGVEEGWVVTWLDYGVV